MAIQRDNRNVFSILLGHLNTIELYDMTIQLDKEWKAREHYDPNIKQRN